LLLGAIHIGFTPVIYKTIDLSALWFAGTGMAFLFLGVVNISRIRSTDRTLRILCLLSNIISIVFGFLVVVKLRQPHAYFSLIVLLLLLILSVSDILSAKE
jgi:hypothetical protein